MKNTRSKLLIALAAITCSGTLLMLALPAGNMASTVASWNSIGDPGVTNYIVYVGTASRTYTQVYSVGGTATNLLIGGLLRGGLYYGAVTAVSTNGLESDYSNEGTYQVPMKPGAPGGFKL